MPQRKRSRSEATTPHDRGNNTNARTTTTPRTSRHQRRNADTTTSTSAEREDTVRSVVSTALDSFLVGSLTDEAPFASSALSTTTSNILQNMNRLYDLYQQMPAAEQRRVLPSLSVLNLHLGVLEAFGASANQPQSPMGTEIQLDTPPPRHVHWIEARRRAAQAFVSSITAGGNITPGGTSGGGVSKADIEEATVGHQVPAEGPIEDPMRGVQCSVCLAEFRRRQHVLIIKGCQHAFHKKCLTEWFKTNSTCPLCRKDVLQAE